MSTDQLEIVDAVVAEHGRAPQHAIPILQSLQKRLRYVPREAMERIAATTEISESQLFGVATFYTQFRLEPVGDTEIKVCHGTACHVGGAEGITEALEMHLGIREGQTTKDRRFTLTSVACLGCCSLAPVLTVVDGRTHGRLDRKKAVAVVAGLGS